MDQKNLKKTVRKILERCDAGASPFAGLLMRRPGFMGLLCSMVKRLTLSDLTIDHPHFAAICELTNLKVLSISEDWGENKQV
jgi:hypothetical protein